MPLLQSGTRLTDTLVVDRMLGEGAYAEVHRVRHRFLGWQALKLFKRVTSYRETAAALEEARLLSTLGHPNIVRVFDANTVETEQGYRGFFTMEYVAGGSLADLVRAYQPAVPVDVAVEIVAQIATGLAVAHDHDPPIVHRDLIPQNVLVGYDAAGMRVRISDFGLAKAVDPRTLLGSAQGTIAYLAPEVLRGEGYSVAADVWSVGVIAYLLLTNHFPYDPFPYEERGPEPGWARRQERPPQPPSRFNPDVGAELEQVVLAALEIDTRTRFVDARALADAVSAARRRPGPTAGAPVTDTSPGAGTPTAVLPDRTPADALHVADEALALARQPNRLQEAADLMEVAVNLSPLVRRRYLSQLMLWRRGVTL